MIERGRTKPLLERLRRRTSGGVVTHRQRALLLAMRGQYREAATLLLANLPLPVADTGAQEAEHRRQALLAATYLAKAGDRKTSQRLVELLTPGDHPSEPARFHGTVSLEKTPDHDALGPKGPDPKGDDRSATIAPKEAPDSLDIGPTMLAKVPDEIVSSSVRRAPSRPAPPPSSTRLLAQPSPRVEPPGTGRITPQLMRRLRSLRLTRSAEQSESAPLSLGPAARYPYELGTCIAERFVLEARIGHGGMAAVYRARDLELEEDLALKVFVQPLGGSESDPEGLRRFRQELKLSRQLMHPHVIRVYDIGVHEARRYITMELLRGSSLGDLVGEPVDAALALCLLVQAVQGVQAAHSQDVVHRDLKPDNLFVTDAGVVKVMDFGIAKSAHVRGATVAGTTAGTPEYMSPEQISDFSAVGPAADQYSLGVVAYELLTGVLPFEHVEMVKLFYMHLERAPTPLRQHCPTLSAELEAVVLRMLAKEPTDRYPDLPTLLTELAGLRDAHLQNRV